MTNPVRVLEQPNCQACKAVKRKLTNAGVPFEVGQITDDDRVAAKALGINAAPIVSFGDFHFGGLDITKLEELIAWHGANAA